MNFECDPGPAAPTLENGLAFFLALNKSRYNIQLAIRVLDFRQLDLPHSLIKQVVLVAQCC